MTQLMKLLCAEPHQKPVDTSALQDWRHTYIICIFFNSWSE
uniref:Uncharacterized protein n=1 Tax=Anguilla anguilla TaxID=7936 RepID=A0A0E9WM64_ANGAN